MPSIMNTAAQDEFTYGMLAVSATTLMFVSVMGGQYFFGVVVMLFMIVIGIIGAERFKLLKEEGIPDEAETVNLALFSILAIATFIAFAYLVPQLTFATGQVTYQAFFSSFQFTTTGTITANGISLPAYLPALLFIAVLVPNAEEQFFRGFIGNLSISKLAFLGGFAHIIAGFAGATAALLIPLILASLPGGFIFGAFHTPVYNGNWAIILTLSLDGTVLIALNSMAGRLSVSIFGHMGNNALSFFLQASSVLNLIPGIPPTPIHLIAPLLSPLTLLGFAFFKRRGVGKDGFAYLSRLIEMNTRLNTQNV